MYTPTSPSTLSVFIAGNRSCYYFDERKIAALNSILDHSEDSLEANRELFESLFDVMSPNDLIPEQFNVPGYRQLEERLQNLAVRVRTAKEN